MDRPSGLTIALPTCNGARHLREALAGLRMQGETAFELIVSDDRSDDETLQLIREEVGDRAFISINSERLGLAGNWNRCVELSRTEWVSIFHQDDVMHPGHLASHRRMIQGYPEARLGLVAGPVTMIDESGRPVPISVVELGGLKLDHRDGLGDRPKAQVLTAGGLLAFLSSENPIRCSAVTIRKEAHQAVGGFDPSFQYAVDWDFWIRVGRDWGFAWSMEPPTVSMRWHSASETHRFKTGTADLDEQVRLLELIQQSQSSGSIDRKAAERRLARAFLNRAHVALKTGNIVLARRCLTRSWELSRTIWWDIASDPRLAVQMATLGFAPNWARRCFGP